MNKGPEKNRKAAYAAGGISIWLAPALAILAIAVFFSTGWMLRSSQRTTENAVYDVSKLYLEELSIHKANQFTDTLESHIQQLFVTVHALRNADASDSKSLQEAIGQMQLSNGFDFFGLIDEQGTVYTRDAAISSDSQFELLRSNFTKPWISFHRSGEDGSLVLITVPMENWSLEGRRLIGAVVGIDGEMMADKLSLGADTGHSFCNIITPEGDYVVHTHHDHLEGDEDLFFSLAQDARFEAGTSLALWQENMKQRQAGMVVYRLQDMLHYTYYMPVEGTDWFITTTLHYDLISNNVEVIRTTLARNSIFQLMLILLVLLLLFVVYAFMHKRNDRLRFEKMQAEENSRAKSTFLSNMSHDIRTPMNAIIGFTNLAIKNVEDAEKTQDYLGKILASGNHLLALINDVLEMSRIESGKIQLEETECNIPKMLHDLNSIIQGQFQSKRQELLIDTVDVTDEDVYCDRLRMNQVFFNLLGNAVKFTPEGGTISVTIQQTGKSSKGYGSYTIRVKDNGIGMTPEFAAKVFTPFERERTSTVSGIQGTGLGMAITKNIIDKMGGTIEVVTAPGEGTEFILRLSLRLQEKKKEPVGAVLEEKLSFDFTGKRLLLVEDNELNREIAVEVLTEAGFEMEEAEDGSVALEKLRKSQPGYYDLILMDIQMPVMDGYEATRAIRRLENRELASIPIIAMTANAFEEDRQAALNTGMNGHLAKPLDMGKLFELLAEVIGASGNASEQRRRIK